MREPEGTKFGDEFRNLHNHTSGRHPLSGKRLSDLSGRSSEWLKFKNPHAPAVRRLEEEDGDDRWEALASVPRLPDNTRTNHPRL